MSTSVNAQMYAYVQALFEHPSKWYESYQENGTKYLKRRKILDSELKQQLDACAGEIFICGIPGDIQAEKIAEIASLLGEVYILRFKVHFSGASRGFAYLQYMDPNLISLALQKLPKLFAFFDLSMIRVCISRNSSKLLLRKVSNMSPSVVYDILLKLIKFEKLKGLELSPGYFEYEIYFKCNEDAVHARRIILKCIIKFGPKAVIFWDSPSRNYHMARTQSYQRNFIPGQLNQYDMKALTNISSQCRQHNGFSNNFSNGFRCM